MSGRQRVEKALTRGLDGLNERETFAAVMEVCALCLRNVVDRQEPGWSAREERFMQVTKREGLYDLGSRVLADLAIALEEHRGAVLGESYMKIGGSAGLGQFFTSYEISRLCAELVIAGRIRELEDQPFVTLHEPSCGAGGMIIAQAETLQAAGINPQQRLHTIAWDLSPLAIHMSYIQLTLLGLPALLIHGNTLTQERFDVWPTFAHIAGGWNLRLRGDRAESLTTRTIYGLTTEPDLQEDLWSEAG